MQASKVAAELRKLGDPQMVLTQQWFFKTGPGEYGEGDQFLGLRVPQTRSVAKQFKALPLEEIRELAMGSYHEERFCALAILVGRYKAAKSRGEKDQLFDFYLELLDAGRVNNWDLVDCSAPYLGVHLLGRADISDYLKRLADSGDLWKQRVAIMFNYALIRQYELEPTFEIVEYLMDHEHDLIHKAAGWMLREAGKKDLAALRRFLEEFSATMPRTMLRYAIEKMSREERDHWLSQKSKR